VKIHATRAKLFADPISRETYDGPAVNPQEPIMRSPARAATGFALAVILASFSAQGAGSSGGDAPRGRTAQAFDMSEYEPVHFSGGNTNAFFDGSEDGASNTVATFDMREYEPVHFSGGKGNAFFDGTESGTETLRSARRSQQ
jgi:hypothetical protein